MSWIGALEFKAKVAPEHRNEWKVMLECSRFNLVRTRFFLSLESVKGTHCLLFLTWQSGELSEPVVIVSSTLRALTGQSGEEPSAGIFYILTAFCFCKVCVYIHSM